MGLYNPTSAPFGSKNLLASNISTFYYISFGDTNLAIAFARDKSILYLQ